MRPCKVAFYVYAESEEQIEKLQDTLNDFVREKYSQGILVTADKLAKAMNAFSNNFFVTNYLK